MNQFLKALLKGVLTALLGGLLLGSVVGEGISIFNAYREAKVIAVVENALSQDERLSSAYVYRCFPRHRAGWICDVKVTTSDGESGQVLVPVPDEAVK